MDEGESEAESAGFLKDVGSFGATFLLGDFRMHGEGVYRRVWEKLHGICVLICAFWKEAAEMPRSWLEKCHGELCTV